jgi:hypothetical protein
VAPNGDVYIHAPNGLIGPSRLWRSTDGGGSFTYVAPDYVGVSVPPNVTIGGGDADLAIDSNGALYFVDLWLADASTAVSTDNGATWAGVPFGTMPIQDRPWVSADPTTPGVAYSVTDQIPTGLWISRTVSGVLPGAIYPISLPEILHIERGIIGTAPPGNLVTNKKGDTYNVYGIFTDNGRGWAVGLSKLPAGGLLTENSTVSPSDGAGDQLAAFPIVAVDQGTNDNLYVVWTDPVSNDTWNIRFASFDGSAWSSAVTIGQGVYPWITAQASGKVDVAWYGSDSYGGNPNNAPAGTVWDVKFAQNTTALTAPGAFATGTAADGVKTGKICTEGTNCTADREFADFLGIAHDSGGHALISYTLVPGVDQNLVRLVKQTDSSTIN